MTQPAIQQRADVLRPAFQQCLGGVAYGGEQIGVAHQVGYLELKQAGLARAEHFTGPALFQVFFGDDKSVVGFAHDAQALVTNPRQQLGSSSCRGRGCQYELILVVAVSFKKKLPKYILSYNSDITYDTHS